MKHKVALSIPVLDTVPGECLGFHMVVAAEIARLCRLTVINPVNLQPHDVARTRACKTAIDQGCDYIMFVDADTAVPFGGFTKLYDELRSRQAVAACGLYYKRGYPYTTVWSKQVGETMSYVDAESGTFDIDAGGTGCMMIDLMWCIDNIKWPWFEMHKDPDGLTLITDDITFCKRIRDRGGNIIGVADVFCTHYGSREVITRQNAEVYRKLWLTNHDLVRSNFEQGDKP